MLHQAARFAAVAPLIEAAGGGQLLDVGSGSEGVAGWLGQQWSVTAVDTSFDYIGAMSGPNRHSADRKVVADARDLPFPDRSFDAVLALDVLEHVPPPDRATVVRELVRVARRRVVVACPAGRAAAEADQRLAAGLTARGLPAPSWLDEHQANGFPEPAELRTWLQGSGSVRLCGHENARWHEWLFRFEFRRPGARTSRLAAQAIVAGLAAHQPVRALCRWALSLAAGPQRAPYYRTVAVLDLPGA